MKIEYVILDLGGEDEIYELETDNYILQNTATEAAEDFHNNHDGWDVSSWPLTFRIIQDGKTVGDVEVDRETVPHFYAIKTKLAQPVTQKG